MAESSVNIIASSATEASSSASTSSLLHLPLTSSAPGSPRTMALAEAATLKAELAAMKEAKDEMARELKALREHRVTVASDEDQTNELFLLRSSLATLATELETEKVRLAEVESKRQEEEDKVAMLRTKVEESRRALMRLQGESSRKASFSSNYEGPAAMNQRRQSFGLAPSLEVSSTGRRSSSGLDAAYRRKSSLGVAGPAGLGLGFGAGPESPSKSGASPLARLAHRRGSASMSYAPESKEEDDRMARLRDLRLGLTSTKISSRRGSSVSDAGIPDFDMELTRRGSLLGHPVPHFQRSHSISEESDGGRPSRPPSAPLRIAGRKNSTAVFDSWPQRRDSYDSEYSAFGYATDESSDDLILQLQGLRIQLLESEESRLASEECVKALKEFIATSPIHTHGETPLLLPPLPSDTNVDDTEFLTQKRATSIPRWSIPRLPLAHIGSRRESGGLLPPFGATTPVDNRRSSSASNNSAYDKPTPSVNPAPIFGAFSFSALVSKDSSPVDGDTSPTMTSTETFEPYGEPFVMRTAQSSPEDLSDTGSHTSRAPSLTDSMSTCSETESESSDSSRSTSPVRLSHPLFQDCNELFGGRDTLDPEAFARKQSVDPTTPTFSCTVSM